MTSLDALPDVDNFLGQDLKTGCMVIACISMVHPLLFGCSLFLPMSYILVTCWIMVSCYFVASIVMFYGVSLDDPFLITIWIWYTLIFVMVMMMMMLLLAVIFTNKNKKIGLIFVTFGVMWYFASFYFIIVANSYRKTLIDNAIIELKMQDKKLSDVFD